MKVRLLKRVRRNMRISDYSHGFYDLESYHNFKWNRVGSYHFMSDILREMHVVINYRLRFYKKYEKYLQIFSK